VRRRRREGLARTAPGRWGAQSPSRRETSQLDAQRRLFEGCKAHGEGANAEQSSDLSFIGIRDDGPAQPPLCRATPPPPCRPPRKPRSLPVPVVPDRRPSHGGTDSSNPSLGISKTRGNPPFLAGRDAGNSTLTEPKNSTQKVTHFEIRSNRISSGLGGCSWPLHNIFPMSSSVDLQPTRQ